MCYESYCCAFDSHVKKRFNSIQAIYVNELGLFHQKNTIYSVYKYDLTTFFLKNFSLKIQINKTGLLWRITNKKYR